MKILKRLLKRNDQKKRRYCRYPWEDFALKSLDYEYTFAKKPLDKGFALTSAAEVERILEANKIDSGVVYSQPKLVDDGKGYGMWLTKIDGGDKGVKGYSLLIPAFEDHYGTKRVIVSMREDFNPPEAGKDMQLENWGAKMMVQNQPLGFDLEMVNKMQTVYHVPVFGYNSQNKTLSCCGARKVVCEEGASLRGERLCRVVQRSAVAVSQKLGRSINR